MSWQNRCRPLPTRRYASPETAAAACKQGCNRTADRGELMDCLKMSKNCSADIATERKISIRGLSCHDRDGLLISDGWQWHWSRQKTVGLGHLETARQSENGDVLKGRRRAAPAAWRIHTWGLIVFPFSGKQTGSCSSVTPGFIPAI